MSHLSVGWSINGDLIIATTAMGAVYRHSSHGWTLVGSGFTVTDIAVGSE